jgi:hypothetical protein
MSTLKQVSYSTLTTEINTILNSGSLTTITLYSDNLGTIMTDNNGKNIENKIISKIDYSHPQLDSDGNITVKGFTVITFNDNSFFKFIDTEDTVWFSLNPVQVTSRFFNNVSPIKTSTSVETTNV